MTHGTLYQLLPHNPNNNNTHILPYIHLLPTPSSLQEMIHPQTSHTLTTLQQRYKHTIPSIIHLHQDLWYSHSTIIKSRLKAKCGIASQQKRIYARQTTVKRITLQQSQEFLNKHHLWSSTKAKFNYGLFTKDEKEKLVAVATFSPRRHITRHTHPKYRSHELIRYCTCTNTILVGGITKLLAAFVKDVAPDDIMTCIDRDWGTGFDNWYSIGFENVDVMPPVCMVVDIEREGVRRYLVGANLHQDLEDGSTKGGRVGIGTEALSAISTCTTATQVKDVLYTQYKMVPVYDAGVERLALLISGSKLAKHAVKKRESLKLPPPPVVPFVDMEEDEDESKETGVVPLSPSTIRRQRQMTIKEIWSTSIPQYVQGYYSDNEGVTLLLEEAAANLLEE